MNRMRPGAALALAGLIAWTGGLAQGQVATSLVNVGEPLDPIGLPGWTVSGISAPTVNGIGGWAINLTTTSGGVALSRIWGSVDGVTPPQVFATEGFFDDYNQTSFEVRIGFDDQGNVTYSASGTGPTGGTDSAFLNTNALAIDGLPLPPGPLEHLYWSFASGPTMSANGIPFFVAGTATTPTGASSARGLFNGTGDPLIYSGREYPNLPAPIDAGNTSPGFSYKVSDFGGQFIGDVFVETTGTGVPSTQDVVVMMTGAGLLVDGQLVQEGTLVPVAAGGDGAENWQNFDYYGVNEMGEYLVTGDTSAATTADEFVLKNGVFILRDGQAAGAFNVVGDIEGADMNESGDWAVIWDVTSTIEAIVFNGEVVLREGDAADFNHDGVVDPTAIITELAGSGATGESFVISNRDAAGMVTIYFRANVSVDGATAVAGVYALKLQAPAGTADDLQLNVTDGPDPETDVPGQITYTVAVRNNGGTTVTGAVVTSNLDPTVVFNAALSDAIAVHAAGVVTANLGTFGPYEVKSYKFVVDVPTQGTKILTSNLTANEADPVPANNSATNETEVGKATDLEIVITDAPDPLYALNGSIVYTVQVTNHGPSSATGVTATLTLDPTTTFNAGLSDPIAVHAVGVVTANIGALAEDESATFVVGVDTTTQGTLSLHGVVTGTENDPVPGNNEETETTLYQLTTDLEITIADSPDPVAPGDQIVYTVTVTNDGPSDATGVVAAVTLDPATAFVSATGGSHDGAATGGTVMLNIGALANGGSTSILITVDTLGTGRPTVLGEVAGGGFETDPDLANNTRPASTLVYLDTVGLPVGVFSTIAESPTSDVPGLPGAKFDTAAGFDRPYRSPDGKLWILSADTNLGTAADEVIVTGSLCSAAVVVQEGVTTLDLGDKVGLIDTQLSINDAGQFAFATNTDAATSMDEVIVQWNGELFTTIAREGDPAAPTGFNYGNNLNSPEIIANGQVWFATDTTNPDTSTDFFILWKNGNAVLLQEGVSIPAGQAGGATDAWAVFDTGEMSVDAAGLHYLIQGDTTGPTATDDILAYDNTVVVQEGSIVPGSGFTSPVDAGDTVQYSRIVSNGDWYARGDNDDEQDWVLKNGAVLAVTDGPIFAGAVERYDDAPFAAGFFSFAANNHGHYVIGGTTNSSEDLCNAVLVLNNALVVARENDPIDLDGNGVFDDGVRIHTFGNDDMIFTDDEQVYISCTLRADGGSADIGDAFLRINLCGLATHCGDLDVDGDVDSNDYTIFRSAYGRSTCDAGYHICADADESGTVGIADYQAWLECYREYTQNPTAQPPVRKPVVVEKPGLKNPDVIGGQAGAIATPGSPVTAPVNEVIGE